MITRFEHAALEWASRGHPHAEALAGDLIEEFLRRGSRRWLWCQLAHAVCIGAARYACVDVRAHAERLALNAAIAGVMLFATYVTCLLFAIVFHVAWIGL